MLSYLSRIYTMIYKYSSTVRENDIILLLKVRRKSQHNTTEHLSHFSFIKCKDEEKIIGSMRTYDRKTE
jgi:Mn-dependent DtxR family transcriptional regulator